MQSLIELSCEQVRCNWFLHYDKICMGSDYYDLIWSTWMQKYNIISSSPYVSVLRSFIEGKLICEKCVTIKNNIMLLMELTQKDKKIFCALCRQLGLEYGYTKHKKEKTFSIYFPDNNWCWEFTFESKTTYCFTPSCFIDHNSKEVCLCCGICEKLCESPYTNEIYCCDCLRNNLQLSNYIRDIIDTYEIKYVYCTSDSDSDSD